MPADWYPHIVPAGYTGFVAEVGSTTRVFSTSGSPSFSGSIINDIAIDYGTGDIYVWNGSVWTLSFSGGGGDTPETFTSSGSPEGVVVASPGNVCWDETNEVFYVKASGVATNTGWQELVA